MKRYSSDEIFRFISQNKNLETLFIKRYTSINSTRHASGRKATHKSAGLSFYGGII